MVVFKMRDSVPSARYSPVCNVLPNCVYGESGSSLLIESIEIVMLTCTCIYINQSKANTYTEIKARLIRIQKSKQA